MKSLLRLTLYAVGLLVVLVVLHVLYMVLYGHVLNPGQPAAHYPAHALASAPWFSTLAGFPLFLLAGRRLVRSHGAGGLTQALAMTAIYVAIDMAFLVGSGADFRWEFGLAMASKFVGSYAGARLGLSAPQAEAP